MTLPLSGPISIGGSGTSDITTEFGMSPDTTFPGGFYGLGGAPSSGPLSFSDFYGRARNSISASKNALYATGFLASDSCTITVNGGTVSSWSLISGIESTRVSKPVTGSNTATISVLTPNAGNGAIVNKYRIYASFGEYIDIDVFADWGNA